MSYMKNTGIYAWKWNSKQVFDCQRDPYFPKAGLEFVAYDLMNPVDLSAGFTYEAVGDDYIQMEYVGRFEEVREEYNYIPVEIDGNIITNDTPVVKLIRYHKDGVFAGDLSKAGLVLGLDTNGTKCLFIGGEYGYFISNDEISETGVSYIPNVTLVTDEKLLIYYTAPCLPIEDTAANKPEPVKEIMINEAKPVEEDSKGELDKKDGAENQKKLKID